MNRFTELEAASNRLHETDDCLVKAVAVVCDLDYEDAHRALVVGNVRTWRVFKSKAQGEDWTQGAFRVLAKLGYSAEQIACPAATVAAFERLKLAGRFLLYRSKPGHIVGVIDGQAHDWTSGRSEPIEEAYRVVPIKKPVTITRLHKGAAYL